MGPKPKHGKEVRPSLLYSQQSCGTTVGFFLEQNGPSTWQMKITILCVVGINERPRASRYQTGKMQNKGFPQVWMCKWQSQSPQTLKWQPVSPLSPPGRMKESEKG